jgi:tyrosine-specific transport protein
MNTSIGAMLIVAGTTIGAGMLALPMATASLGLWCTLALMLFWWGMMLYGAMLMVRLCRLYGQPASLPLLFRHFGPKPVEKILAVVLCFLFYALIAAYLTGGASVLYIFLPETVRMHVSVSSLILAIAFLFGFLISLPRVWSDATNRLMVSIKLVAFVAMMVFLWPSIQGQNLLESHISFTKQSPFWIALPIVFTSFGFHGSIPSILKYVGLKSRSTLPILLWGSLLPCFLYLLWIAATVGVIPHTGEHSFASVREQGQDIGILLDILSHISGSSSLLWTSSIFSLLAITTSLLGVGMGLHDFFQERFSGENTNLKSVLATFSIPLLFALFYPKGFIMALGLAAIALALLAIIFPAFLCLKLGKRFPLNFRYERVFIALLLLVGLSLICIELSNIFMSL